MAKKYTVEEIELMIEQVGRNYPSWPTLQLVQLFMFNETTLDELFEYFDNKEVRRQEMRVLLRKQNEHFASLSKEMRA